MWSPPCTSAIQSTTRFFGAAARSRADCTISSYRIGADGTLELRDPVAGATREVQKGIRDQAISRDGRYLYAIDADARKVFGWTVDADGRLMPAGESDAVPDTVAGLAA